ncbi:MAG: hypothetical protein Q8R37_03450 [Nanoarchaeota archaeon]|nr:hypothetical protein [Nanoarchaeota archaeon]
MKHNTPSLVSFFLRVGLAVVFLYAAISSLLNPLSWVGFFPSWLRAIIPDTILLYLFSGYEIILSLWLFSSWRIVYAALLSIATLVGIIITNLGALDIIFRDVAILFMAVSLAVLHWEKK